MKTHDIPHDLDLDTAKLVARKAAEAYSKRFAEYNFKSNWVTETRVELAFTVVGKTLDGAMVVKSDRLALELDVPFMLRPFQSKAIELIEREANVWIAKARNGELET